MVGLFIKRIIRKHASLVRHNWLGIDGGRHRSTDKDLRHNVGHDIVIQINQAVFCHGRIGEVINFTAFPSHTRKGITSATRVQRRARRIHQGTKAIRRFLAASHVRHTRIVRNVSLILNEFVRRRVVSTVTASGLIAAAVENVLNGQVNVIALTQAGNFDAIRETAECSVCPAGAAVLRHVLIERMRQVGYAVHVAPVETVG